MKKLVYLFVVVMAFTACEKQSVELVSYDTSIGFGHVHFRVPSSSAFSSVEVYDVDDNVTLYINEKQIPLDDNYGFTYEFTIGKDYGIRVESDSYGSVQRTYLSKYAGDVEGLDLIMYLNPTINLSKWKYDAVTGKLTATIDDSNVSEVYVSKYQFDGIKTMQYANITMEGKMGELSTILTRKDESYIFPDIKKGVLNENIYYSDYELGMANAYHNYLSKTDSQIVVLATGCKKLEKDINLVPFEEVKVNDTLLKATSKYNVYARGVKFDNYKLGLLYGSDFFIKMVLPTASDSLALSFDIAAYEPYLKDPIADTIFRIENEYGEVLALGGLGKHEFNFNDLKHLDQSVIYIKSYTDDRNIYVYSNIIVECMERRYK